MVCSTRIARHSIQKRIAASSRQAMLLKLHGPLDLAPSKRDSDSSIGESSDLVSSSSSCSSSSEDDDDDNDELLLDDELPADWHPDFSSSSDEEEEEDEEEAGEGDE